jgi:hypothetical protein
LGIFRKSPDTTMAARSGTPVMESLRPSIPPSVPVAATGEGVSAEVTATPITGPSALDTQPDARQRPPAEAKPAQPEAPKPETQTQPARKNEKKKKK